MRFDHILNWRLLEGSHEFPGDDGGTCINEAAIVAAGFPYQSVGSTADLPPCFSRPISAFALQLNDSMPDEQRQELLMPFVMRLAGTADTRTVEVKRAKLIVFRTIRDVLPHALLRDGMFKNVMRCASSKSFNSAALYTIDPRYVFTPICNETDVACRNAAGAASCLMGRGAVINAVRRAAWAIEAVAEQDGSDTLSRHIYGIAASILDEALGIGRQAEPMEIEQVASRMEEVKAQAIVEERTKVDV